MANLCEFEMRARGSEEALNKFFDEYVIGYDYWVEACHGNSEDQIWHISGSCAWCIESSMMRSTDGNKSILDASELLNIEIEAVGIVEGDVSKGSVERFHIKDGRIIKSGEYGMKKNHRKHTVTVDWELDYSLVEKPEET